MKIRIELLSDLCTTSAETYNSLINEDITYDKYGIPYIPAKRIKGCIREAAIELMEFGIIDNEKFNVIFGGTADKQTAFWINNAKITHYDEYIRDINNFGHSEITRPQNVIKRFVYIRKQTSVDKDSGVAKESSLRTIRVIKKGLVFEAECGKLSEGFDIDIFRKCVSLVKHIGMSRTRGLGLVNMTLEGDVSTQKDNNHIRIKKSELGGFNKIHYKVYLKSSMICKSPVGNQAISQDYIAGSKILGLIAGSMNKDDYAKIMDNDGIIVSNAYIVNNGSRCVPAKVSLQKQKDQTYDDSGKMVIYNMIYEPDVNGKQMTAVGISYIDKDNMKVSVDTQISYHHKRPDDKSIGRATGKDNSSFYQLASICAGQTFAGYIYADKNNAEKILEALQNLGEIRMGYGRNSEFGAVDFYIDKVEPIEEKKKMLKEVDITFLSDVILYNDNGMLSMEKSVLENYLKAITGSNDIEIENAFFNYVTIGGYNVTWNKRKPVFNAIGKGSVIRIKSSDGINVGKLKNQHYIGERTYEGYGEMQIEEVKNTSEVSILKEQNKEYVGKADNIDKTGIINELLVVEFEKKIYAYIVDNVINKLREDLKKDSNNIADLNTALAKLRLIYKDVATYEDMMNQINGLVMTNKRNICEELCKKVVPEDIANLQKKAIKQAYNMDILVDYKDGELYKKVYGIYISELKYLVKIFMEQEESYE